MVRCILVLVVLVVLGGFSGACDRGAHEAPAAIAPRTECTPMPAECPAELECELSVVDREGRPARVCGGTACCESFCELNGCSECCVTEARAAR
jgi:hypothetical protein